MDDLFINPDRLGGLIADLLPRIRAAKPVGGGEVKASTGKDFFELILEHRERLLDRNDVPRNTQIFCQSRGVIKTPLGRILTRHRDADNILLSKGCHRDDSGDGRIDSSAQTKDCGFESALRKVIPNA